MQRKKESKFYSVLAIALLVFSIAPYGFVLLLPYFSLTATQNALFVSILIVCGEVIQWIAILIIGKQLIIKFKKQLNPMNWFKKENIKVFVFKTSVTNETDISIIKSHLDDLPQILKWNFDLEDDDNILRIESQSNIIQQVVKEFKKLGYQCEELI
ncbi:hypothetical protein IWQ47_002303 [Aquimarina sp. EL_43]|uniref:transporter suffix domain-containing protein n=1 Tax=unclassified Aquimarina TaxID=2627091 RepID=UPI0018C9DDCE|nr:MULTISPECIES: transporter suffix domain-containing protein [unclassified Aquimarina]MBG6130839.1 hypothetical protein [Aquimarina sp. EL_35]MBG6151014.1 hypothetical protein [Aquimarina sp. EL_32]MBG6169229.1 hypothetical protein [Aquimarina sp. EL_43]